MVTVLLIFVINHGAVSLGNFTQINSSKDIYSNQWEQRKWKWYLTWHSKNMIKFKIKIKVSKTKIIIAIIKLCLSVLSTDHIQTFLNSA